MLVSDPFQRKYREAGRKAATSSLYSTLPETLETQHAREMSQLQSRVSPPSRARGVDGWVDKWVGGWIEGWVDGLMGGWIDRWMDVWVNGWMGG